MKFRLRSCVFEITLACSFSCRYCGSRGGRARDNELTTEECLSIVEQLADLGCRRVSLIGGEVFMRPDWATIVKSFTDHNIRVCIITNGFLFRPELIKTLREVNIESIAVSLDGPEDVHDKYRQTGSYKRAIEAIHTLNDAGIPTSVISTLNAENVDRLEELYLILRNTGIGAWQLQACSPMGNAANSGVPYSFDVWKVIDFVRKYAKTAPFLLGFADNIGYYTEDDARLRGNINGTVPFSGCSAGINSIGIDSVGNVRGCESMYADCFIEGNLREKKLRDIWEDPDAFAYNRHFKSDMLTGNCATCSHGKYCAGGCRSYNYFVHGKIYESPHCALISK